MLFRHSLTYVLGRGLPAAINSIALIMYTRVLTPQEYGIFAVVLAYVALVDSMLFRWQRFGLLRFHDSMNYEERRTLLATLIRTFVITGLAVTVIAFSLYLAVPTDVGAGTWIVGVLLVWATGFYEMVTELVRVKLQPLTYGRLSITRAIVTLATGWTLAAAGLGATGVLIGTLIGYVMPVLLRLRMVRDDVAHGTFDVKLGKTLLLYGLPLSATFALNFVISTSDRLIITWMLGEDASGLYSAAYNIPAQSIGVLVNIVGLAGLPLVFRSMESAGVQAARNIMREYLAILMAVSLPAAVGLVCLSGDISRVLLGTSYQVAAEQVIPIVAIACLIYGVITEYLSLSFQLARQTKATMWSAAVGALLNVVLNILFLPKYGVVGAAYATFWSYVAYFLVAVLLAWRIFPIPCWTRGFHGVILATAGMILVLEHLGDAQNIVDLAIKVSVGLMVYLVAVVLFDAGGVRARLVQSVLQRFSSRK